MSENPSTSTHLWKELRRRKVIHFLIAYLAASFAVIEFTDITSTQFNIPGGTIKLLYLIAVIGLPIVILLPWFINRKKGDGILDESIAAAGPS